MTALPPDWTPPPRSLLYVNPVSTEDGPGLDIGCDCGAVTQLIIADADKLTTAADVPFACDGCNSVHWFTVRPVAEGGKPS